MVARQRTIRSSVRRGFTLVEIVLVVGLLALLASFTWPLLRTDSPHEKLQRSAESLVSLLSMCRAEAMLRGHPFRLTWPEVPEEATATLQPIVEHEGDPLDKPGEYRPMMASWAHQPVIDRGVRVQLVQIGELDIASLEKTDGKFELPETPSLEMVQFQPDGTAQPAVFVLTTPSEASDEGDLQYWVVLDGMSGLSKTRRPPTPEQLEAMLAEQAELPDLRFEEKTMQVLADAEGADAAEAAGEATLGDLISGAAGGGASSGDLQEIQGLLEQALRSRGAAGGANTGGSNSGGSAGGRGSGAQNGGNTNANEGGRGGRNTGGRNRGQNDNAAPIDDEDDETTRQPGRGQRSRGGRNR